MDEDTLRGLAKAMQTELPTLITDLTERGPVEAALDQALSQSPGTAKEALRTALRSHPATRDWMRRRAPIDGETDRAIGTLGSVLTVGVLFVCPEGNYGVMRQTITGEALFCPIDGSLLQRHTG
jgi:hypothetical protein